MIKILSWNYNNRTHDLLDEVVGKEFKDQKEMSEALGVSIASLKRSIAGMKKLGILKVYRYVGNNSIWCIGDDAENLNNGYEVLATARYRILMDNGGDAYWFVNSTAEEQENMLIDIPVFNSDREDLSEDLGYRYYPEHNILRKVEDYPVDQELHDEVENMWKKKM